MKGTALLWSRACNGAPEDTRAGRVIETCIGYRVVAAAGRSRSGHKKDRFKVAKKLKYLSPAGAGTGAGSEMLSSGEQAMVPTVFNPEIG